MERGPLINNYSRQAERDQMVQEQIMARGVTDPRVLHVMRTIPRHQFVLESDVEEAYEDHPLSIGFGQTISQPYIVAFMTEALNLQPHERVLEIGSGSGYQAAVLSQLAKKVFSIEIVESLADRAKKTLNNLGINNVIIRTGDGYQGWLNEAPFDAIMLTAAPEHIPQPLLDQLVIGGRLILPLGKMVQRLILMKRTQEVWKKDELFPVAFVPMTGEVQELQLKE
ncbi:MAG: protein-L-isoaspartate(D-aspartate) O-methyltransferase [Nitrospirota bacterium]|nr:protein-L-isoaspartate(D-aspartate) O-methyltransferase [Nitrospirota bacterium]